MILEVAILNIKPGQRDEFEKAFEQAQSIISSMQGYRWHQLQHSLEHSDRYILLVQWEKLEDHTVGFRESSEYQKWKALLHYFYDPFPEVEYFELACGNDT